MYSSRGNSNPFDDDDGGGGFGASSSRDSRGSGVNGFGSRESRDGGGYGASSSRDSRGGGGYGASSSKDTRGGGGYGASSSRESRGGGGYGVSSSRDGGYGGESAARGDGRGYGGYSDTGPSERDGYQDKMMQANTRMEESSANSLRVLNETMRIGVDTAEELERQAESLDTTERRLDEMHVDLDKGEKNMRRIKSMFGGVSLFSRKKNVEEVTDPKALKTQTKKSTSDPRSKPTKKQQQQQAIQGTGNDKVDQNLDEMEKALLQLRGIGHVIGAQLDDSDQQLDRVKYKMDRDQVKIEKLNKDIKRELYK